MTSKLTTPKEAVSLIKPGMTVGMGGFSNARKCMVMVHELLRAGTKELTIIGTNLSLDLDMLVAMGQVKAVHCGTGNLERYGIAFNFRRAVQNAQIEVEDHSHLGMCLRLTAGELGLPFIPIKSWAGSDLVTYSKVAKKVTDPFTGNETLVLKTLQPDVSILHVQIADALGNFQILGCSFHDREMVRASDHTILVTENLVEEDYFRTRPEHATLPYNYIDAVIHMPYGAHPTGVYRYYDHDGELIKDYQARARKGEEPSREFIEQQILSVDTFEQYLDAQGDLTRLRADEERGY